MSLLSFWTTFDAAAQSIVGLVADFATSKPGTWSASSFTLRDECFLEGLLSRAWQEWSVFCRRSVIASCMGTTDGSGNVVVGLPGAPTEQQISWAAIQAKRGRTPVWGGTNSSLRLEPTWGDVDVLAAILRSLNPSNSSQLLAAASTVYASAKAIQLVRNASAHNHHQNIAKILALGATYVAFGITHPTHALFWAEPASGEFLVTQAIQELSAIARIGIG